MILKKTTKEGKSKEGFQNLRMTMANTDNERDDNSAAGYSNQAPGSSNGSATYCGSTLIDTSATPTTATAHNSAALSSCHMTRAKLERLVMGEAGTMGYTGCALVAQSIRDAMNRSGTSSIDQIIYEYQYFGSTAIEPNSDVKNAVSFIFDQDGSAVQHRVLCFYIGYSAWHETQTFLTSSIGGVRFF